MFSVSLNMLLNMLDARNDLVFLCPHFFQSRTHQLCNLKEMESLECIRCVYCIITQSCAKQDFSFTFSYRHLVQVGYCWALVLPA